MKNKFNILFPIQGGIEMSIEFMSDGNAQGLTDRSKTLSFRYDGNVHGFVEDLNRSK